MSKHKQPNRVDPDSFAYLKGESWLFRFDERIDRFRAAFGTDNVTVIDYDRCVIEDGSVIGRFADAIGARHAFATADWEDIWENARAVHARPKLAA